MAPDETEKTVERVRSAFKHANRVFVITGAGVSAESGIRTFRGREGWWKNNDPAELASPEGFARNPRLVWEWYIHRIMIACDATPNPGHLAIAEMERRFDGFLLLTQNVDGLHQRAGNHAVHEIHGSIMRAREVDSGVVYPVEELDLNAEPPLKTSEGKPLRPDVVWFGEIIREKAVNAVNDFLAEGAPDVLLLVGTSAMFAYIQQWVMICRACGSMLVEVNPEPGQLAGLCDVVCMAKAGEVLPRFLTSP